MDNLPPQPQPKDYMFDGVFLEKSFTQATEAWSKVCMKLVEATENKDLWDKFFG